jgi:hypothetical protein
MVDRQGIAPIDASPPSISILLIERESVPRKTVRRELDRDGHAVVAVGTIGEALARLRSRHFELVISTDGNGSKALADDYGLLIDAAGLVARSTTGYELYLPGIGIDARAILLLPTADIQHVRAAVRDVWSRLERMGVRNNGREGSAPRDNRSRGRR